MSSSLTPQVRALNLGLYSVSLLFGNIQVFPQTSLPFIIGGIFFISKIYDLAVNGASIRLRPEGVALVTLYLYLVGVDLFMHSGSIINAYYISFGLNCILLIMMADEFSRDAFVRERAIQLFAGTAILIAAGVAFGLLTSESQSGRLTFMRQNENELAVSLLIAFAYVSIAFVRARTTNAVTTSFVYLSTMLLLNAIVSTGTRFALFGVIGLIVLLMLAVVSGREKLGRGLLYTVICVGFVVIKVISFAPMVERLFLEAPQQVNQAPQQVNQAPQQVNQAPQQVNQAPQQVNQAPQQVNQAPQQVHRNNLTDLGGRVPLWRNGMDAFLQSPIVGLGHDGFEQFVLTRVRFFDLPHNFPIEIAAISGIGGVALLTLLALQVASRIIVHWNRVKSLEPLIWSVPLVIMSIMLNITHLKVFWFLLAYFITFDSGSRIIFERPSVRSI